MTSVFPKQPGYMIYHDPTKVDFKKVSSMVLQNISNGDFKTKKGFNLPRVNEPEPTKFREGPSLSYSQTTYVNHFGPEPIKEFFQPDWVKLDKQVLRFYGYFKESVDESRTEHSRIRSLNIYYYVVDDTIEISEAREINSGIPQGSFLRRSKVLKYQPLSDNDFFKFQDKKSQYYGLNDMVIGKDLVVYGKFITLYNCDDYTREFCKSALGVEQPMAMKLPQDNYHKMKEFSNIPSKRDNLMKDWLEHRQGGGKVKNQKQFLENDRRVLKFNSSHDSLKYEINYYLADDTVEIKELFFHNSGRIKFPLFLKRNKLPKRFSVVQPGEEAETDYVTPADIEVS